MNPLRKKAPCITPKGQRYPGSGRVKGTPNRVTVEARVLVGELVTSADYQRRLRRDFELRRVHPAIEAMVWAYHIGKPRENVTLNATIDVNARIEEERRAFAALDLRDLEQLAAESQGLVDRALALAKARTQAALPQHVVDAPDLPEVSAETLAKDAGSDNQYYRNQIPSTDIEPANSDRDET